MIRLTCLVVLPCLVGAFACDRHQGAASQVQAKQSTTSSPPEPLFPDTVTQAFSVDLDSDGTPDSLILHRLPKVEDPGAFDTLRLVLSRSGAYSIAGSWDAADSSVLARLHGNRVPSRVVYTARFARAGDLVFLFGAAAGCCLQSLDIYRITASGVTPYYHENEFKITSDLVPGDMPSSMEGIPTLSEVVGSTAPDAAVAATYKPWLVIQLLDRATIDTSATAAATRLHEGGFPGLNPSRGLLRIKRRDSTLYLWDEYARKRVP